MADPVKITTELVALLQTTVPLLAKWCQSKTRNAAIIEIEKNLTEGTDALKGLWDVIPEERREAIESQFAL